MSVAGTVPDGAVGVVFAGTAREYFGIWIVNLMLTIATVGIWSPWAKVRNTAYLLGNTSIDGRAFGYHAKGHQILLGRLVVLGLFAVISGASSISPAASVVVWLLLLLATPWLINRGLMFNAAMTSWSTIRFGFRGSYWRSLRVFVMFPFLSIVSLGLFVPYATRATKHYTIGGHRLGASPFAFSSDIRPFWVALLLTGFWGGVLAVVVLGVAWSVSVADPATFTSNGLVAMTVILVVVLFALMPFSVLYAALLRNAIYAGMTVDGGHCFHSAVSPTRYVWIAFSNAVAIACSLGMLLPWARVRMTLYLCSRTWLIPMSSLDDFIDEAGARESALGDAWMDLDGIDVGVGV